VDQHDCEGIDSGTLAAWPAIQARTPVEVANLMTSTVI
jgi:hypothetical protein